jgi:hypothetical protein
MSKEEQTEEIIKVLNSESIRWGCGDTTDKDIAEALYETGYRKQEWISVDERLPEDGVWVLGYSAKSGRGGLCNCLKSYVREFGNYDDTTHWLPLPEFPKKKGE